MLRGGAVDVALAYHFDGPLPGLRGPGRDVRWIPLTEDPLHVVLPGTHPLGGRPVLNLAGLADEPWVLGCLKTEAYLRRYAEQAGFSPDVRGSTTDYFFARSLVAAGVGVSLIPTVALTPALPGVRAVPLDAPTPARHIGAAVLRRPARPEVTNLIEALRQHAEATAPPGHRPQPAARADPPRP
ncbi:LysR substrate-binding domain-containing protein [Streptomyces cellulosae]|jgi:DNA-binding transcriptional LysR family regulator